MLKTIFSLRIDSKLLAEAQRLVDAGEVDSVAQMIEDALRDYLKNFDAALGDGLDALAGSGLLAVAGGRAQPGRDGAAEAAQRGPRIEPVAEGKPLWSLMQSDGALEAKMLRAILDDFDAQQLKGYDDLVEAYSTLVQHPLPDVEMFALVEIFLAFPLADVLSALHEAEHSKVPLSPAYLGALLSAREAADAAKDSKAGATPRSVGTFARSDGPARVFADFDNPLAGEVASLYQKEIGELTEKVRDQIATYIVEFPDLQRWHEAFEAAAGMNKRSLRYVLGVLRGNGLKIVEQKGKDHRGLSKSERHREAKRSRNKDYKDYWDAKLKTQQDAKPD